jgi:hypothetical protein
MHKSLSGLFLKKVCRRKSSLFIFMVAGLTIAVLSAECFARQDKTTAAPVFEINATKHDFGDLFAGEQMTHYFQVRNTGNAPLQMSETPIYPGRPSGPNIEMDFQTRLQKEKIIVVINGKPSPG